MNNLVISVIRTAVASLWGLLATFALRWGVNIDTPAAIQATMAVVTVVVYAALRGLEEKYPQFIPLFGVKGAPEYNKPK